MTSRTVAICNRPCSLATHEGPSLFTFSLQSAARFAAVATAPGRARADCLFLLERQLLPTVRQYSPFHTEISRATKKTSPADFTVVTYLISLDLNSAYSDSVQTTHGE